MNIRSISNRPCATCLKDTRHHSFTCTECGQDTQLRVLDKAELPRRRLTQTVEPVTTRKDAREDSRAALRKRKRAEAEANGKCYGKLGKPRSIDLTPRERQIAELLATANMAEIARQLNITRAGVSSLVQRACDRVGVQDQWELARYAVRQKRVAA